MESDHIRGRGFTLIELLIVIGIIGILTTTAIFIINPTESLKKSRDARRIADLASIQNALGTYVASQQNPYFGTFTNPYCFGNVGGHTSVQVFYSASEMANAACMNDIAEGVDVIENETFLTTSACHGVSAASLKLVDGTGWIPVDLTKIEGGSPLTALPVDPINVVSGSIDSPDNADLVYRFVCQNDAPLGSSKPSFVFELDAVLESDAYTKTENKMANDAGDNPYYYEAGSSKKLIGAGQNF